jgi:RNA polymerase subunit RPABC4/transcription elongation factor Spt4
MVINETQSQSAPSYEYQPPRPYVWKTDEFQLPENSERKAKQINQVQPLGNMKMPGQTVSQTMSAYQQSVPLMNYGYRCPRCGTQNFPQISKKISTAGWIVFAVLLVMFFPLFWIGFLMKEEVKICPVCNLRIG